MKYLHEVAYSFSHSLTYGQTLSFYALESYKVLKNKVYTASDMQHRISILEYLFLNSHSCKPEFSFYNENMPTECLLLRELYLSAMFMSFADSDMEALPMSRGEASDKGAFWDDLRSPFKLRNSANDMLSCIRESEGLTRW